MRTIPILSMLVFPLYTTTACNPSVAESRLEADMKSEDFSVKCGYRAPVDFVGIPDPLKLGLPESSTYREMLCTTYYHDAVWSGSYNHLEWNPPVTSGPYAETSAPKLYVYPIESPEIRAPQALFGVIGSWVLNEGATPVTTLQSKLVITNTGGKDLVIPYTLPLYDIEISEKPLDGIPVAALP